MSVSLFGEDRSTYISGRSIVISKQHTSDQTLWLDLIHNFDMIHDANFQQTVEFRFSYKIMSVVPWIRGPGV